jgi:hypothetical protein
VNDERASGRDRPASEIWLAAARLLAMALPERWRPAVRWMGAGALMLAIVPNVAGAQVESGDKIEIAFVVLGEEGKPMARVITRAPGCPPIMLDGVWHPMDVRAPAGEVAQRTTASSPEESKASNFPVFVCEKPLHSVRLDARVGDRVLPLPKRDPKRIVILGDTGCRLRKTEKAFQACRDESKWPFRLVAEAAAAMKPDLVIHTGDFHYRENACPPDNDGCKDSAWGYGYDTWSQDLFEPAAKLFAAAPWVVTRGNHEECRRAGQGWWRLLDPRPSSPKCDCNDPANDAIGNTSDPYALMIAADSQLIVFDSAWTPPEAFRGDEPLAVAYRLQLRRAAQLAQRAPHNIWVNHHPILGYSPNPGEPGNPGPGSLSLQSAFEAEFPGVLPPGVQIALAGHYHLFEAVSFHSAHPAQVIVGTGGSWWQEGSFPNPFPKQTPVAPALKGEEVKVAKFFALTQFYGFALMEREASGWRLAAYDHRGGLLAQCGLHGRIATCRRSPRHSLRQSGHLFHRT